MLTHECDISDVARVQHVWAELKTKGISVDVLVLNAAAASALPQGLKEDDLVGKVWSTFEVNLRSALLMMMEVFRKQGPAKRKVGVTLS